MLEDPKLILTLNVPEYLVANRFPGLETHYAEWVNYWVAYGDGDWIKEAITGMWNQCDDSPESISICNHVSDLLRRYAPSLEVHFNELAKQISYLQLPNQISVLPTGLKGVVLWTIT